MNELIVLCWNYLIFIHKIYDSATKYSPKIIAKLFVYEWYESKNNNVSRAQCVMSFCIFIQRSIYRSLFPLNNHSKKAKKIIKSFCYQTHPLFVVFQKPKTAWSQKDGYFHCRALNIVLGNCFKNLILI